MNSVYLQRQTRITLDFFVQKFAFLCLRSLACELRLRATFENVVDLLPGLLSWMLVGVPITFQWESGQLAQSGNGGKKKYEDLLVNIKKHCCGNVSAKLKSWNHIWKLPERLAFPRSSSRVPLRAKLFFPQKIIVLKRDFRISRFLFYCC